MDAKDGEKDDDGVLVLPLALALALPLARVLAFVEAVLLSLLLLGKRTLRVSGRAFLTCRTVT